MTKLEPRKPRGIGTDGRPLEATVQNEIRAAFDALPWVQCWRNNTGKLRDGNGRLVTYGLATGSSDLIGIVLRHACCCRFPGTCLGVPVGRFYALEVKRPGEKPTDDQLRFLDVVRAMGGAAAWCDNAADAVAFIHRARDGGDR